MELNCYADGVPDPVVIWMKDGVSITESFAKRNRISIYTSLTGVSMLRLDSVTLKDNAEYTCIATNAAGTDQYIFTVNHIVGKCIHAMLLVG